MRQHGTLNHVSVTVSDLDAAMLLFAPLLEFFGFTVGSPGPYAGTRLTVNINTATGMAFNIWQAKSEHPFAVYEPGLHHIAFNAGSRALVEEAAELVRQAGYTVLEGPEEFPFAEDGYYAFYFSGPDDLKLEVVYMPALD